jgi:cobalt-zinc-cadmium efflux system membrane fusion protein
VKAAQPLLVIESPDIISAVNDLAEARTNVDKTRIALDIAEKSVERARRLHAQEALATKELQSAEAELARAQEDYRRAESSVSVVRNRLALLGKTADEIARLESSPPDETDRKIVIRAPIGGTVVDRKVGSGQYIKPDSQDPLYLISDLSSLWITADIYETDLPNVHVGAPVDIRLAAYPDRAFPAKIFAINPTVDSATRTVKVRCVVPNPGGLLKPEMFARIRVGDAVKQKVVTVPSNAILTEGERSHVLVEESAGHFRRREVKSGREVDGNTVVESGLRPGDRVVTSGVLLLNSAEAKP